MRVPVFSQTREVTVGFFRKKLPFSTAIGVAQRAVLRRNVEESLREIANEGELTDADLRSIVVELPKLELAVVQMLLWQDAHGLMDEEAFGERFGFELTLALQERTPVSIEDVASLIDDVFSYVSSAISRMEAKADPRAPWTFFACQEFVARVLGNVDLGDAAARARHFQVFDVAKQAVRALEAFRAALRRDYKFVSG